MTITSKAPGRICLFGDHQDYLSLPIIACSINRFVTISGTPNNQDYFNIDMPDLGKKFQVRYFDGTQHSLRENIPTPHTHHLIDTLAVVARYGCQPNTGYDLTITSDIPINAGLSSSSAVVVAWTQWLLHTFGCDQKITPALIGRLAYEAEVLEKGAPGGKMDQYTSAIGGTIFLETDEGSRVEKIPNNLTTLIIAESGIPKDTTGLLTHVKGRQLRAIARAHQLAPLFDIATATLSDYEKLKHKVSAEERPYLYAAIKNHRITLEGLAYFGESPLSPEKMGHLMTDHHEVLRDCLKITVPRIDAMIDAALQAGAYGAKIVGSGGGGSMVAVAPAHKKEDIINALITAGAVAAYEVSIGRGAHIQ